MKDILIVALAIITFIVVVVFSWALGLLLIFPCLLLGWRDFYMQRRALKKTSAGMTIKEIMSLPRLEVENPRHKVPVPRGVYFERFVNFDGETHAIYRGPINIDSQKTLN